MDYDLIVVGAGPAGSATAAKVAAEGFRVLVLEEHPVIGRPLQCSGFVSPRTLDIAGVGQEVVLNSVKGAVVHCGQASLALGGERVHGLVLDRTRLDQLVAAAAEKRGVAFGHGCKVVGLERVDGHVEVRVERRRGGDMLARTRLVVGADGWNSVVARWMGVARAGPTIRAVGIEAEVRGRAMEKAHVFVGNRMAPGWFGWAVPLGDGRIRLGVGADPEAARVHPRALLEMLLEAYPEHFASLKVLSYSGGFIPLYAGRRNGCLDSVADRVMLVGDAARQVKSTSGGGIYTGLVAAECAAATAVRALGEGDLSASALASYERAWRSRLGQELERGRDVRQVFLSLSDDQLQWVLRLFGYGPLQRIISRYGDIDYPSAMFARLAVATPPLRALIALSRTPPLHWMGILGRGISKLAGGGGNGVRPG
ncbi:MAG: NAD(P)/FAD-dependent oxidoreductase [Chloroflexi bacterium]|nr:NAD(P)/FAD-dependent oxidoreductase [Chloroflexota bacterium]